MTYVKISGIKIVRANGSVYRYHRATGRRLKADPDTHLHAFLDEVKALDALAVPKPLTEKPGSLGALFHVYKQSREFTQLKPATLISYRRAMDALRSQHDKPLPAIDQPYILELRDEIFEARGRWLANMAVKLLSIVLGWGVPRGLVAANAGKGVPKVRRLTSMGVANKAWRPSEVDAVLKAAAGGLRKAVALAYYAGLRKADVIAVPLAGRLRRHASEIDLGMISKNGRELTIFEAKRLTDILNAPDEITTKRKRAPTIVVNRWGQSYTADGLDSVFDRIKRDLVAAGAIRPGLTFHGLRKSLGKRAADLGFSENDIAGALGQANPASARPYTIEAARTKGAYRVFKALEKKR